MGNGREGGGGSVARCGAGASRGRRRQRGEARGRWRFGRRARSRPWVVRRWRARVALGARPVRGHAPLRISAGREGRGRVSAAGAGPGAGRAGAARGPPRGRPTVLRVRPIRAGGVPATYAAPTRPRSAEGRHTFARGGGGTAGRSARVRFVLVVGRLIVMVVIEFGVVLGQVKPNLHGGWGDRPSARYSEVDERRSVPGRASPGAMPTTPAAECWASPA
jgi:hypothetical protein